MLESSQKINLRTLLRLSLAGKLHWLHAEPDPSILTSWVSTSVSEAREGDVLLIVSEDVNAKVLGEASLRHVGIVLVLGELSAQEVLESPLPIACLTEFDDIRSVQQQLVTVLVNQRAALVERGVRIHTQLSQLAADGAGLEGLAVRMSEISGRGIVIQDKRLGVLAQCPSGTLAGIWEDVVEQVSEIELLPGDLHDRKQTGSSSFLHKQALPGGLVRLLAPIVVGQVARGYLSLLGISGEIDELDQIVLEQGILVCAVEMARAKSVREAQKRLHGDLLTALLQDSLAPRDASLWVTAMDLDTNQPHTALRFSWFATQPPSPRRLETLINSEITRRGVKAILSPMGNEMICFCQVPVEPTRPETALAFAQAVFDQAQTEYPNIRLLCGVGTSASELSSWRISFRQAGQALEMARRFNERRPLYYPDLSVYRLLLQLEHSPELLAFRQEILGRLLEHENADEFLRTLTAYFEHHGNLSQASEALFVHRNTLIYRMERIADITGWDLVQTETRLAVQLALHIQRMLK